MIKKICKNPGIKVSAKIFWRTLLRECIHLLSLTSNSFYLYMHMYAWEILSEAMRFGRWAKGTREPCVSCRHSVSWVHTGTSGGCQDLQQQLLLEQEREKTEAAFQICTSKNLLSVLQLNGCLRPLPYWDWINQPFTDSCGGPLCRLKHKHKKKQKTFFLIIDYFSIFKFLPEAQHEV